MSSPGTAPELLKSVNDVRVGISALVKVLEDEYPKREEVERRFTKKKTFYRVILFGVAMFVTSIIAAYFVTFTTLSVCFLTPNQNPNGVCSIIPGYSESLARNDTLLHRFENLIEVTQKNEKRIAELEAQLKSQN